MGESIAGIDKCDTLRYRSESDARIMLVTPVRIAMQGKMMKLASVRLIATDIRAMVSFYEMVTGATAQWLAPVFAEIVTSSGTLAIGAAETVALFKAGSAEPGANRTAILEFQVDDIDAEYARLQASVAILQDIQMMPWGNKTFHTHTHVSVCLDL